MGHHIKWGVHIRFLNGRVKSSPWWHACVLYLVNYHSLRLFYPGAEEQIIRMALSFGHFELSGGQRGCEQSYGCEAMENSKLVRSYLVLMNLKTSTNS